MKKQPQFSVRNGLQCVGMVVLAILLAGCASTTADVMDYPVSPRMATTLASGVATISWNSEPNELYTVFYTDAPRGQPPQWMPLSQAKGIKGTGRQIIVEDRPPAGVTRRYLLLTGDQHP